MSVLSVQNIQETFIGKNIARTSNVQVTNPNGANYIADGEVVIVNTTGGVYDTTQSNATSPWIQVVQRIGDNLIWSSKINYNRLVAARGKTAAYGQEQIYHIGYNGSAGSLDITSGLDFTLTVIENQDDMMWSEQKKKNVVNVPNNLVTTQLNLASAIVKNQMKKYNTDGSSITAVMLNDGSTANAFTGATTVAVVHGSNVIVPNAAITNSGFGAGTVIRLGCTNSGNGTAIPAYTVQGAHPSIANAWILDQPYAGPSNSALAVANTAVVSSIANWGVRFTGKALPFRRDFFKFKRVGFTLQMSGFGATVLSKTQEAAYGSGDGRLVLEEESFTKGFEGALNRMTVPLPLANENFVADGNNTTTVMTTAAATLTAAAITSTGGYATLTTSAPHGFAVGQVVTISGNTLTAINGTWQVMAVPTNSTFVIASTATGTPSATSVTPVSTNGDAFVYPTTMYSCITLEFTSQDSATVVQPPAMPQLVKIFMPVLAGQASTSGGTTTIQQALNDWTGLTLTGM